MQLSDRQTRRQLSFLFKRILNILRKQNDLIYGSLSVSKFTLFLWEQEADYWFNAIVDQSLKDLVRDSEQSDATVALWVSTGFEGLGIATTSALLQIFRILSRRKQKKKKLRNQNFKQRLAWIKSYGQIKSGPEALPGGQQQMRMEGSSKFSWRKISRNIYCIWSRGPPKFRQFLH